MDLNTFFAKFKAKPAAGLKVGVTMSQGMVLWLAAILILLADAWALQSSLLALYRVKFEDVGAREVESTRINFQNFKKAIDRQQSAETYVPTSVPAVNPFKEVPKQAK